MIDISFHFNLRDAGWSRFGEGFRRQDSRDAASRLKLDTELGWGPTTVAEMIRAARVRAGFHVDCSERWFVDCLSLWPYRLTWALEAKLEGMRNVIGSACMWGS